MLLIIQMHIDLGIEMPISFFPLFEFFLIPFLYLISINLVSKIP